MKPSDLTVTDMFCGAGGSSLGAEAVGLRLQLGMNHWARAIETHNSNFQHADHICADISQFEPRRVSSTHILIASPECTNHSQAKTRKAHATLFDPHGADGAERSRATMMDVPRFAEYHNYEIIVVENVCEVVRWPGFVPWLQFMGNLGYEHEFVSLNSLVAHPTPQSRDRLYVVFWKRGNPAPNLRFDPVSYCPACATRVAGVQTFKKPGRRIGKYRQQYDYRCPTCRGIVYPYAYPAASAIDWSLPTQRIGDRARPLAPATRRRVEIGLERFGQPAIVQAAGHTYEAPGSGYARTWSVSDPIHAQTATLSDALAVPPFLAVLRTRADARSLDDPIPTLVAGNVGHALVQPFITHAGARVSQPRTIDDPMPTLTTKPGHAIVIPPFLTVIRGNTARSIAVDEPLATITAEGTQHYLIEPFIAELRGGRSDARSAGDPLATVCASGQHHALVTPAFYTKNYGPAEQAAAMAHSVDDPLGTVTSVDHHSLVTMPFLTSYYGTGGASAVHEPVPTVTTRDRHALVDPAIAVDDCGFRMLEPHEIQAAMAFHQEYVVTGNKRERVRQLGNAVTPPIMRMLLERCVESLA
jgi:DNA (cytosine-5)-methyltransferase 1